MIYNDSKFKKMISKYVMIKDLNQVYFVLLLQVIFGFFNVDQILFKN